MQNYNNIIQKEKKNVDLANTKIYLIFQTTVKSNASTEIRVCTWNWFGNCKMSVRSSR